MIRRLDAVLPNSGNPKTSYLYNWCAAMKDTSAGCATTRDYTAGQPASPQVGICPGPDDGTGFRLPIGGANSANNEFIKLDIAMGGTGANRNNANTFTNFTTLPASDSTGVYFGGVTSGFYIDGYSRQTENGYWWSSTATDNINASHMSFFSSYTTVNPNRDLAKRYSFAVRCIL